MSGFFWNVRGLNKSTKHSVIKSWVDKGGFQFGCVLETRVKEGKASRISKKIFRDWSMITNYEFNRLGRIWVVWKQSVRLTPFFKSGQMITCSVKLEDQEEEFFCSFIYASNFEDERRELWSDIRDHHNSPIIRQKPWLCFGDFNEILDGEEHSTYINSPSLSSGMRDFQEVKRFCSLDDLAFHGPLFTWCNKREEGLISKKLDRVLKNVSWGQSFPHSYSVFEAGGCSDHLRCRIHLDNEVHNPKKPFKFVNAVATLEEFQPMVAKFWSETQPIYLSTSSLFRFSKKLKDLKPLIRNLSREKIGHLSKKTEEAFNDLCSKQEETLKNPTAINIEEEHVAFRRWDHVSGLEENFLKQRSKLHWLAIGDHNNKTFHNAVVSRAEKNTIREIKCRDGLVVTKREEIKKEAESFFQDFLQYNPEDFEGISVESLAELLVNKCSVEEQDMLTQEVSADEIRDVLFSMPSNKSPGPDGYNAEFYKAVWPIVGKEFIIAVQSFFVKGFLPKGMNSTILALIPKKLSALEMKDYRPISCCNVIYKVISKIIANRMKHLMPKLIALNQSAFVKDRLLIENLLLATELVKDYHKEGISSRCAIKIDISKAFDSVQWPFVLNTLRAMNFPTKFIHWISLCITTASFSVQVNGELAGFFRSARGLRQGCALSPYLFVICMNVLSKLLDNAASAKQIGFHPKCKNIGLTHLSFADDIMVLTDGKVRSIEGIVNVFDAFARYSGLKISLEKSTIYLAGVSDVLRGEISTRFSFDSGQLPVRYLGLPLLTKRMTSSDYLPLIEKIRNRISSWTARFLSIAGRHQLINSVLMSISNFWLSAFRLPRACLRDVEKLCSAFLWSGPDLNNRKAKMAWDDVCKPKREGGLGLRPLKEANTVCCLKLIWRITSCKSSMWVNWIHTYLLHNESFWSVKENTSMGSWMWRKLLKYRTVARSFHKVEIGNGEATSFWFDVWSDFGCLRDVFGSRGVIDLGIPLHASVAQAWTNRRRRRHRIEILQQVETMLETKKQQSREDTMDTPLWRSKTDRFRPKFQSKNTGLLLRQSAPTVSWHNGIWFKHSTPKYSLFAWLALHNRLTTGDRMLTWNVGASSSCVFCRNTMETRQHLFFSCSFSAEIWTKLVKGLLLTRFTTDWNQLILLLTDTRLACDTLFLLRYVFQATLHSIWRERNARRHGEVPTPTSQLIRFLAKQVRNRVSSICDSTNQSSNNTLQTWFASRSA